jgi:hypothetical protein
MREIILLLNILLFLHTHSDQITTSFPIVLLLYYGRQQKEDPVEMARNPIDATSETN